MELNPFAQEWQPGAVEKQLGALKIGRGAGGRQAAGQQQRAGGGSGGGREAAEPPGSSGGGQAGEELQFDDVFERPSQEDGESESSTPRSVRRRAGDSGRAPTACIAHTHAQWAGAGGCVPLVLPWYHWK